MTMLIRKWDDKTCHKIMKEWRRHKALECAKKYGARKAAQVHNYSPTTIRKWQRRFADGEFCIQHIMYPERSYRPPANKTPQHIREKIIRLRKETKFGPERLVRQFHLPVSPRTVSRILRQSGLSRKWGKHQGRSPPNPRFIAMLDRIVLEINRRAWPQMMGSDLTYEQRRRVIRRLTKDINNIRGEENAD